MYNKILVPIDIDREKNAIKLCQAAADLSSGSTEIHLLSVMPGYGMSLVASYFPADAQEQAMKEVKAKLKAFAQDHIEGEVSVAVLQGKRAKTILAEAGKWQADLIVIGSRKKASHGGKRALGSCSSSVADRAECTVMIVR